MDAAALDLLKSIWGGEDDRIVGAYADIERQWRDWLLSDVKNRINQPFPLRDALLQALRNGIHDNASDLILLAAKEAGVANPDPVIIETLGDYYRQYLPQLAGDIENGLNLTAQNAVQKGLDAGMGEKAIAHNLLGRVTTLAKPRLRTIARTELTAAATLSRVGVFAQAGVRIFEYAAILDDRTTHTCRAAEGMALDLGNPLARQCVPPRHWRCRALLRPAPENMPPATDQALQASIQQQQEEFPAWGNSRLSPFIEKLMGAQA